MRTRILCAVAAQICLFSIPSYHNAKFAALAGADARAVETYRPDDVLKARLDDFFAISDSKRRAEMIPMIEEAADRSFDRVADMLPRLSLWSAPGRRSGRMRIPLDEDRSVEIAFRLPMRYDPRRSWPVVLIQPGSDQMRESAIATAARRFSESDGTIFISPSRPVGGRFYEPDRVAGDFRTMVRAIRRVFHIDGDRMVLYGVNMGADRAWLTAAWHPDLFAAVFVENGYPQLPYPNQTYPVLLRNLWHVPIECVYTIEDHEPATLREMLMHVHWSIIENCADRFGLPITMRREPHESLAQVRPLPTSKGVAGASRIGAPTRVSHWFRYPGHGRAYWLRATEVAQPLWTHEQLSIQSGPDFDRGEFITETIKEYLYYIGASVDGQTIDILTKGCAEVEVAVFADLVDLTRPVTIRCNGVKRYDGRIEPSIGTLLNRAYDDWEFARPVAAEIRRSIRGDGSPP